MPKAPEVENPVFPYEKETEKIMDNLEKTDCIEVEIGSVVLTKREYFAAMAIQGLIASNDHEAGDRIEEIPQYAVMIADALLEALGND